VPPALGRIVFSRSSEKLFWEAWSCSTAGMAFLALGALLLEV
jgi:hypothetical protein